MAAGSTGQMVGVAEEPEITGHDVRDSVSSRSPSHSKGNLATASTCFHVPPRCYICSSMPNGAGGDGEGWKVLISLLFCCLIITNQILLRYGKFNNP